MQNPGMMKMRHLAAALAMGCLSAGAYAQGAAANYPYKPVRIILTQGVGGAVEIHVRLFAGKLGESLGKAFVIEHRQNLDLGAPIVARSAPDGHTLLAVAPDFTSSPSLDRDLTVDPIKDFAPISLISQAPYYLTVHPGVPAKNIQELIQLGKAQPGKLNFGAGLPGTGSHLVSMWFISEAGIKATYVPYKGATNSLVDLVAGRLSASIASGNSLPYVQSGKLRVLGSTLARRSKLQPDIPTIAEQGLPGFATGTYRGLVAPAGTPAAIINKLAAEITTIAKLPEIVKAVSTDGSEPITTTPEEFKKFIAEDVTRWRKVVEENKITLQQ